MKIVGETILQWLQQRGGWQWVGKGNGVQWSEHASESEVLSSKCLAWRGVHSRVPAQHCFFWKAYFLLLSTKPRESYLLLKGHSPESNMGLPREVSFNACCWGWGNKIQHPTTEVNFTEFCKQLHGQLALRTGDTAVIKTQFLLEASHGL